MTDTIIYYQRFSRLPERNIERFLESDYAQIDVDYKRFNDDCLLHQFHSHASHYADSVFEGIRAKLNHTALNDGTIELAVLNFDLNTERFFSSMQYQGIKDGSNPNFQLPPDLQQGLNRYDSSDDIFLPGDFTPMQFREIIFELIRRNIKAGKIQRKDFDKIYIRPIARRDSHPDGKLGVYSLQHDIVLECAVQAWGDYLPPGGANLILWPEGIENPTRRIKSSSNYGFGTHVKNTAMQNGFDDALLTDNDRARFIEEATGANFFLFFDQHTIATPPLTPYILPGITRRTVIELARNMGFTVNEMQMHISLLNNKPAAFLTGTATGIGPVKIIYDPKTSNTYKYNPAYGPLSDLRREFTNLITGQKVSERNQTLQERVRSAIVPLNGLNL